MFRTGAERPFESDQFRAPSRHAWLALAVGGGLDGSPRWVAARALYSPSGRDTLPPCETPYISMRSRMVRSDRTILQPAFGIGPIRWDHS
jgi:hypothetical protein